MTLDMCWKKSKKTIFIKEFVKVITLILGLSLFLSCERDAQKNKQSEKSGVFKLLKAENTGISFKNTLKYDKEFNVYTYRNYYNGGGVAIGDIIIIMGVASQ